MKVITFQDIINKELPVELCYRWAVDTIKNKNKALLPAKISMKPYDGRTFCNVMPSMISVNDTFYSGVKVVTRYPNRVPSLDSQILLYNAETGENLALMDANWITAMRTGTVAAHSILTFAKKDFCNIGIIGLGNIARATVESLISVMPQRDINIKLFRYNNDEIYFVQRFSKHSNIHFSFVESYDSLVSGSDVVISCVTYAPNDFCSDSAFDEGVLVVPIHTLGFTNCDLFFDKVFADDRSHVEEFKNFSKFKKFAEVSDVVNNSVPGRENDKERILAYNIGISVHDISFAAHIYELFANDNNVSQISLDPPQELYWV